MNNYRTQQRTQSRNSSRTATKTFLSQNHIFWTLICLIGLFILSYAYLVNATVLHTAGLQKIDEEIVDTKSEISQLEFALIEESKNFTKEYASTLGLVEIADTVFVSRTSAKLSFND